MNHPLPTRILLSLAALLAVLMGGCGSSPRAEFRQALTLEETVGEHFARMILGGGIPPGPILVITDPQAGERGREAQERRIQGLRKGLGDAAGRLVAVPAGQPEDPAVMGMMNDHLPLELLTRVLGQHPGASAVVSLAGFPYLDAPPEGLPPFYVFGVNRQELARLGVQRGWARAVVYSKGSDDLPAEGQGRPVPVEILESYAMEVR